MPVDNRDGIVSVVTSPLGFFALALLIIEGFLAIVVIGAGGSLAPETKFYGILIAAGAFALVVLIVAAMVWFIPENLTYRGADWMEREKMKKNWGNKNKPLPKNAIEKEKGNQTKADLL